MSRLFWLGLGVAAGVALNRKANSTARQLTPSGVAANVGDALRELAGAVGSFGAEVRAGMAEREHELHEVVERASAGSVPAVRAARQPVDPGWLSTWEEPARRGLPRESAAPRREARAPRRARRAEG